jgi:hypothetical protein
VSSPPRSSTVRSWQPHLDAHIARPLATTGIRRARLTCATDGVVAVEHELVQAWRIIGRTCASLVCVGDDSPLAGTTVLLREEPFQLASLWLSVRTSALVRALEPFRIEDHVLGSDFVYDDFRFWTPRVLTEAARVETIGARGESRLVLHGSYAWRRGEPVAVRAILDEASGLVVAATWTRAGATGPFRRFEASDLRSIGGVVTPGLMQVVHPQEGYESRMVLASQATDVPLPPSLFDPDGLGSARVALGELARALPDT